MQEQQSITIVDTHALIRTPFGYCPGLPASLLEIFSPRACIAIECAPHRIVARRSLDKTRPRDAETEEELQLHQDLSRSYLTNCSIATGSLLCLISNEGDSLQENTKPLVQIIRSLV